jgi:hypothetical protein
LNGKVDFEVPALTLVKGANNTLIVRVKDDVGVSYTLLLQHINEEFECDTL